MGIHVREYLQRRLPIFKVIDRPLPLTAVLPGRHAVIGVINIVILEIPFHAVRHHGGLVFPTALFILRRLQIGLRLQPLGIGDIALHLGQFFRRRALGRTILGLAVLERPHIRGAFLIRRVFLQVAQLVQHIGHFLLIRLRLFDLLDVVEGRILG